MPLSKGGFECKWYAVFQMFDDFLLKFGIFGNSQRSLRVPEHGRIGVNTNESVEFVSERDPRLV